MSDYAKRKMVDALEELVKKRPISKVTISDIVASSGVSRQTFYNNFTDIYDLLFWSHAIFTQEAIDTFWVETDFRKAFRTSLSIIRQHAHFYQQIIRKEGINSFQNSFHRDNFRLSRIRVQQVKGAAPSPEEDFMLDLYWSGTAKMLVDWIDSDMKLPPAELAELFYQALPAPLGKYWAK